MSTSSVGTDQTIDGSKIDPLKSDLKYNTPHGQTREGVVGTDDTINSARIDPLGGTGGASHVAPHADSQGVVGREGIIGGAKIDPLRSDDGDHAPQFNRQGLDDEAVDAARIDPMGSVRE